MKCGASVALICAKCGTELPASVAFCFACGQAIAGASSGFVRPASPESYTPKRLAERILTSKAALEGERKQVTVLFADLKGSMALLADRDPEEARKILDPVLEHMMEAVHRYEGTVNQVMGDGIMALFGAPLALEDHAVRACYAALRMQDAVKRYTEQVHRTAGVPVQIRVGLNSGEVVVRAIGSDLHMDYTAVGETTHLAARMEQLASPGSILLAPSTVELVEGFVAVKSLGPVPVKGLAEPVTVHELTGAGPARTRLQAGAWRGLTRFVGRDAELAQLHRAEQLVGRGHGQVVAIVAEGGVGKSRLVYEFTHSHHLHGCLVLEASSVSYGRPMSYLPVIALLKGYFKIQDRDDLQEIREKVTGNLLALDEALKPTLPALLALVDVPVDDVSWQRLDPAQRRQRTLEAVKWLMLREARQQPVLVIFEDLHWIDTETQAFLDTLVDSLGSARLMLLVTYRPEYGHAWGGKTYYSQLRLDPLPPESAEELLDTLLGDDPGLFPLKQRLIERGNPFFLEEIVHTLVETKALAGEQGRYRLTRPLDAIRIPATVHAMLAARIDRLAQEDKSLLQIASVIGKDVPMALLLAIAELSDEALHRGLDHLQAAEFLYEIGLYPDLEYSFKHAFTYEVTYAGLLKDRRRELHARIVDAIETLHRDRLGEQIERLAHHAVRGELREKARHYLRQAGVKAAARSALQEARGWFEQALDILEALPDTPSKVEQAFDIRLELRPVLHQLGELRRAVERLHEAGSLAEQLNDDYRRGRVSAFQTNTHSLLGELDEALASGTRALEIAVALGNPELRILTTTFLEQAHYFRGDYERVVELATESLAALPAEWVHEYFGNSAPASVYDRVWLVQSLAQLGRFTEAAAHEAELIRLAEATHHAFTIGLGHWAAATAHLLSGDWSKACSLIEHAIAVARTANVGLLLPPVVASSAWPLAHLAAATEALGRIREAEHLLEREAARGVVGVRGWDYHLLGRTCLLLGRLDQAQALAQRALESSPCQRGFAAHALHLIGDIATAPDRFDAATGETHYRQALALAHGLGMRPLVGHCHAGLARVYHRTDKRQQAQEHFVTATTIYRDLGMTYWLKQAETELSDLLT